MTPRAAPRASPAFPVDPAPGAERLSRAHSVPPAVSQSNCNVAVINVGAPAAGMNAAVRSAVRVGIADGHKMLAIYDGFEGFAKGQVSPWGTSLGDGGPPKAANLGLYPLVNADAALQDDFCSPSALGYAPWALQDAPCGAHLRGSSGLQAVRPVGPVGAGLRREGGGLCASQRLLCCGSGTQPASTWRKFC